MMGGLTYERAKFPHDEPAPKVANVTLLLVHTDSVAMMDQEKEGAQEIEPTPNTEVGEKVFSYEEYQKVLSDIYVRAERVPNLVNRGMTKLLKLRHDIYDAEARYSSVQQGPTPLVVNESHSSFQRIPGADGSMKRKESFVDKMCRRGQTKPNAPKTAKATMGWYKKPTKLVSSQKQAKNANCIANHEQEADAQVQPSDGAEGADSVVGVLATPIVKKTARKGRGAKTVVDGAQKPAKAKAAPRARKEKAPKVPKEKPATRVPKAKPAPTEPRAKPNPRVPKEKPAPTVARAKPAPRVPKEKPITRVPKLKPAPKRTVQQEVGIGAILDSSECNGNARATNGLPVNGSGEGDTNWTPPIETGPNGSTIWSGILVVVDPAIQSTVLSNIYPTWLSKGVVDQECTKQSAYLGGLHSGLLEQFMKTS
ncbi:unnamed protein product [Calypogeia fissa]